MAHYDFDMPVTEADVRKLKVNDTVTLNRTLFGIRDATLIHMFDRGRKTRFDLKGARGHPHTAPNVKWVGETAGASVRLCADLHRHHDQRAHGALHAPLMEQYGVRIVIGKGGLFAASQAAFRDLGGVYLAIIGGAAALETTWIEQIEDVDLDDLNPESLWKFRVKGFGPLLVAMDSHGGNLYTQVNDAARDKRAGVLAALGVKMGKS